MPSNGFNAHSTPEGIVNGWSYTCCGEHLMVKPGAILGMVGTARGDGGVDFGGWAIHPDCFPEHVRARFPHKAGAANKDLRGMFQNVTEQQLTMLLLAVERLPSKQDQAAEVLRRLRVEEKEEG